MDSGDIAITILGIALVWGGVEISRAWIARRQKEVDAEVTVELSKQETERLRIFSEAVKQSPILNDSRQDFEDSQNRLLKSLKPTDSAAFKGVELSGQNAMEITQQERARATEENINGTFQVLANDASKGADFKVKLSRVSDGLTFSATVPFELDLEQRELIKKAEWSKGAFLIYIAVSAKLLRGTISDATVYHVSEAAKPAGED